MICQSCGANVDDRAVFCPVCGSKLEQPQPVYQNSGYQPPQAPTPPYPFENTPYRGNPAPYRAPITQRSIPVAIILSIVTCGIYGLYWLYCVVTDLNAASGETNDTSGGMVILLSIVTCNIYMLYWYYKAGEKINKIHEITGRPRDDSMGILMLILSLIGLSIINLALIQSELNAVAES